jgi:enediyne biosynthesis protein E4
MRGMRSALGLTPLCAVLAGVLCTACAERPAASGEDGPAATDGAGPRLRDRGPVAGSDFATTFGASSPTQIPEVKGGGLALFDWNGDGHWDLFVPNGATLESPLRGPGARLFAGEPGLAFRDATGEAQPEFSAWGQGVAVGDVNGNGRDDLYVAAFGPDALLLNREDGRLVDGTRAAKLGSDRWGAAAAFADLDLDGDLDLFLVHYLEFDVAAPPPRTTFLGVEVFGGPFGLPATGDRVYENLGDGTFRDVTDASGITSAPAAHGLGLVVVDLDGDGLPDVYVGNDSMPNHLWRNLGGMRFEEVAEAAGAATNADGASQATMGLAVADVDGDGRPDLFSTNFADDTNTLLVSQPGETLRMRDRTRVYGLGPVSRTLVGWAAIFGDLDHSGQEDLVIANGHVYDDQVARRLGTTRPQLPQVLRRVGPRFEPLAPEIGGAWLGQPRSLRGALLSDLDGDGDLDLLLLELNGAVRVVENLHPPGDDWLQVELADHRPGVGNRRGIGARLDLFDRHADGSERRWTRWLFAGGSYMSQGPPIAHFGVPGAVGELELHVRWPDGALQRVDVPEKGQHMRIERSEALRGQAPR